MKKAIVLGGTRPHITLIQKLKNRGYYVILLDYFSAPVAKEYADEHIQESTLDKDLVLRIAKEQNVDLVISTCIDQANVTAAYVCEKLGLARPYDYEVALNVTDKLKMKDVLIKNNIPTSKYKKIEKSSDLANWDFRYPIIIKPTDSNSSKGIFKIEEPNPDLDRLITEAISFSRTREAIVEEFVTGQEIGIDTFVTNGVAKVLMIKERRKIQKNANGSQNIVGCIWPMPLSPEVEKKAEIIANQIAKAFGLKNSALMIQAILKDGEISVIEFGARIGGGESYRIIKDCVGFDYVEASISTFTGEPLKESLKEPEYFYADNFIYVKECTFDHIDFGYNLLNEDIIDHAYELKSKGSEIDSNLSSNNRVGTFVVKSKTIDGLYKKINTVLSTIQVYDTDGKSVMRKDIY